MHVYYPTRLITYPQLIEIMKHIINYILLASIVATHCSSLNCVEGTSPNSSRFGWFGRRRGSDSHIDDIDLRKASAMHSFTGAEGFDHNTLEPTNLDEMNKNDKSKQEPVKDTISKKEEELLDTDGRHKIFLIINISH